MEQTINIPHILEQVRKFDIPQEQFMKICQLTQSQTKHLYEKAKAYNFSIAQIQKIAKLLHTRPRALYELYPICDCTEEERRNKKMIECLTYGSICEYVCMERKAYHHPEMKEELLFADCQICQKGIEPHNVKLDVIERKCVVKNCNSIIGKTERSKNIFCRQCLAIMKRRKYAKIVNKNGEWIKEYQKCVHNGCNERARINGGFCYKCWEIFKRKRIKEIDTRRMASR